MKAAWGGNGGVTSERFSVVMGSLHGRAHLRALKCFFLCGDKGFAENAHETAPFSPAAPSPCSSCRAAVSFAAQIFTSDLDSFPDASLVTTSLKHFVKET